VGGVGTVSFFRQAANFNAGTGSLISGRGSGFVKSRWGERPISHARFRAYCPMWDSIRAKSTIQTMEDGDEETNYCSNLIPCRRFSDSDWIYLSKQFCK